MLLTINGIKTSPSSIDNHLHRALIISLFTWRRKKEGDDTDCPYGWWGDSYPSVNNDKIGSRLYLLKRSKLTNQTANFAKIYLREALQWMIDDGWLSSIEVDVKRTDLTVLCAKVILNRFDRRQDVIQFDNLWSDINV